MVDAMSSSVARWLCKRGKKSVDSKSWRNKDYLLFETCILGFTWEYFLQCLHQFLWQLSWPLRIMLCHQVFEKLRLQFESKLRLQTTFEVQLRTRGSFPLSIVDAGQCCDLSVFVIHEAFLFYFISQCNPFFSSLLSLWCSSSLDHRSLFFRKSTFFDEYRWGDDIRESVAEVMFNVKGFIQLNHAQGFMVPCEVKHLYAFSMDWKNPFQELCFRRLSFKKVMLEPWPCTCCQVPIVASHDYEGRKLKAPQDYVIFLDHSVNQQHSAEPRADEIEVPKNQMFPVKGRSSLPSCFPPGSSSEISMWGIAGMQENSIAKPLTMRCVTLPLNFFFECVYMEGEILLLTNAHFFLDTSLFGHIFFLAAVPQLFSLQQSTA